MLNLRSWKIKLAICCAFLLLGCNEDTEGLPISQFDGPQDVALVCYDEDSKKTLPLNCCKEGVSFGDDGCEYGISSASLYAFVTQTTSGEVAVVNLDDQLIVDQDRSIPYNSFIPVGGQPNDIVATEDGTRVYTANRETGDISVIRTDGKNSVINNPNLLPANSIDLGGATEKIALVKGPVQYKDKVALVTQADLGRLTVVALDPEDCPPDPEKQIDGCVKAYLYLGNTEDGTPIAPYAMTEADGQSIFVGSNNQSVIFDIQLESLVEEAMNMDEIGEIPLEKVKNEVIDISPYRVRALSIEPKKRRWLYGIETDRSDLIAMDLGKRIPGSGKKMNIKKVDIPGIAESVKILELEENDDIGPFTFNGTFAVVATSRAGIGVVDIEDADQDSPYFKPHRLRSIVDFDDEDEGSPEVADDLVLTVDGDRIDDNRVGSYIKMDEEELDGGVGCDEGSDFKKENDRGIHFRCDPYQSRREKWYLTWEGPIGVDGAGIVINMSDKDGPWKLLNEDENSDFCNSEIYVKGEMNDYPGDRLIITSEPLPYEGSKDRCNDYYGDLEENPLIYRIVGISKNEASDQNANVILFEKLNKKSKRLLPECFQEAINFEVRASKQWTIKGSRPDYIDDMIQERTFSQKEERCLYDDSVDSKLRVSKLRVNEGQVYKNDFLEFKLDYGESWEEKGPQSLDEEKVNKDVSATVEFEIIYGYEEMYRIIGATQITDMAVSPDDELMLVDKGGEGLIVFDLIDDFSSVGRHIN